MQISDDLGKLADEPVSLPTLDVTADKISFHHNDPAYHSINVPNFTLKVSFASSVYKKCWKDWGGNFFLRSFHSGVPSGRKEFLKLVEGTDRWRARGVYKLFGRIIFEGSYAGRLFSNEFQKLSSVSIRQNYERRKIRREECSEGWFFGGRQALPTVIVKNEKISENTNWDTKKKPFKVPIRQL